MDTDTTKVCFLCFLKKESKTGLEGKKINVEIKRDAFPTKVV